VADARLALAWTPRDPPLSPRAVVGERAAAYALGRRLLERSDPAGLAAVAGPGLLVVIASGDALPWVDGALYLGADPAAPSLLVPTALTPTVPVAVLELAVRARAPAAPPIAVLPSPLRLVPCGAARAVDRDRLAAWLADAPGLPVAELR
jgi:hypothetical protein